MKTTAKISLLVPLLIIQFLACKKKPEIPPVQVSTCKLVNFTYTTPANRNTDFSGQVNYNSVGNPISVIVSPVQTGNTHALFLYDKYNRLTDYIASYGNNTDPANLPASFLFEFWTRYVYADDNPASLPIRDTFRTVGQYTNGVFVFGSLMTIETNTYDAQNRIVQVTSSGNIMTRTYAYDANGNLVLPGVTYDNKKNFRQGNKVFMLIDRNYSKNNPLTAAQYNSEGYPTVFPPAPAIGVHDSFIRRGMNFKTMDYACSVGTAGAQ